MPRSSGAASLDAHLLAAHEANDRAALVALYQKAAETAPNETAEGFFLTQAYIFALEAGDQGAEHIKSRLVALKRDY